MSNYVRVIPRDLFNEAKLLKCLGALYLAADNNAKLRGELHVLERTRVATDGWEIRQDQSSGAIMVCNVQIILGASELGHYTPLNSRAPYPLYLTRDDWPEPIRALTDDGKASPELIEAAGRL